MSTPITFVEFQKRRRWFDGCPGEPYGRGFGYMISCDYYPRLFLRTNSLWEMSVGDGERRYKDTDRASLTIMEQHLYDWCVGEGWIKDPDDEQVRLRVIYDRMHVMTRRQLDMVKQHGVNDDFECLRQLLKEDACGVINQMKIEYD